MDKRFITILVVIFLAITGLFIFTNKKNSSSGSTTSTNTGVSNHTEGNSSSKVHLVVYGDFQCSVCEQMYPIETQVLQKYLGQITFTFKHFPLDSAHPNARAASRAAEAAGLQGKFFEMHDLLYGNQNLWINSSNPQTIFDKFATSLSLNITKFDADFSSGAVNSTINADYQEGVSKGVDGTPTYFLNGTKLNNENIFSVDQFSAVIDQAIKNASK